MKANRSQISLFALIAFIVGATAVESLEAGIAPISMTTRAQAYARVDPHPDHVANTETLNGPVGEYSVDAHEISVSPNQLLMCEVTTSTVSDVEASGLQGTSTMQTHWVAENSAPPAPGGGFFGDTYFYYSFLADAPTTLNVTLTCTSNLLGDPNEIPEVNAMAINHSFGYDNQYTELPLNGVINLQFNVTAGFHTLILEHYPNIALSPWTNTDATAQTVIDFSFKKLGDMNCDGAVNGLDVQGFTLAVMNPAGYAAAYPTCSASNGDYNNDSAVTVSDVASFVQALLN